MENELEHPPRKYNCYLYLYMAKFINLCIIHRNMWKELQKVCPFCILNNIGGVWGGKQTQRWHKWIDTFWKEGCCKEIVYNIVFSNIFNIFKYIGQQYAFLKFLFHLLL